MARFTLSILFSLLAAGLCDLSYGQDVKQLNGHPITAEDQVTERLEQTPQPKTISNAFTRSASTDSPHASDIETRVETSQPTARKHARAYYEPDATYSNPGLKPLLSPFPRTRSPRTIVRFDQKSKPEIVNNLDFEFGTVMTFPAVTGETASFSNPSSFNLASTPLHRSSDAVKTKVIEISADTPTSLLPNQPNLFEIKVRNPSAHNATNIIVQMQISKNLMLTGFDRVSWIDEGQRTVSWKIDNLSQETETIIRFRAQSNAIGRETHLITAGMENQFQGKCELVTEVVTAVDEKPHKNALRNN